ncbi:MAG: alpha-2-macroglobulin family protein [Planctomycetota bacterium]
MRLDIEAKGPNDDPIAFDGICRVHRLRSRSTDDGTQPRGDEYELGGQVFERAVQVDASGQGHVDWITDQEGPFRVVVVAEAGQAVEVTGSTDLWIAKRGGRYEHYAYRDVELVADRLSYAVGDTARLLINTRFDSCYVLLTAEADDLLDDRMIFVKGGTHVVELPITRAHLPNFELTASVLRDNKIYQDRIPVVVPPADRFLDVQIETPGDKFYPRQEISLDVAITDSAVQPAPAEVVLMIVDASIYYIQAEFREQIEKHFYGQKRPHLVQTQTSFDYHGAGHGIEKRGRMAGAALADTDVVMALEGQPTAPTEAEGQAKGEFAVAQIRKDFPDTVLWAAHVKTGETGRATVDVTMPDTLTTWRIHAIAVDRDTRVGQTSRDVITRKDIIARLQAPRFLVEGDEPLLTVIAHNYLPEEKTVRVTLESSGEIEIGPAIVDGEPSGQPSSAAVQVQVPPNGEVAVDFPARALVAGRARLTATAAADVDADAIQIDLPVITYGADRFVAQCGSIRQQDALSTRTVSVTIPQEVAPESPLMEIHLNPSIAAVMIDALPFLLDYPYGCTEQTMSRFLPAVVTRRTLRQLDIDLAAIERKIASQGGPAAGAFPERFRRNPVFNDAVMNDMIQAGLQRLAELQRSDGGWGWWSGGVSNPYMTAYVVYGLTEALAADVPFDRSMLDRGVAFLRQRVVSTEPASRYSWHQDDDNVRTWMLYALAMSVPDLLTQHDIRAVLDRIYEDRDGLTDYSRAMLMIALHRIGQRGRVGILIENLYNTVRLDDELATASWGESAGYRYWYNNGLEATAMVLRALLMASPDHAYVPRAVNWLVRNRRGSRWFSTKDTAFAVYALADYLVASGELQADMTVGVTIDDRIERSFRITPENALTFDAALIVSPKNLTPGTHTVELTRNGQGNLYYGVYVDYFTRQDPIEPAGHEVYVTRKYARLVPKQVSRTRDVYDYDKRINVEETYQVLDYDRVPIEEGDALASGDLVEVQLAIDAKNNFEYLIFEDPKPAGCEPTELHSGYRYGQGPYENVELRDQKTVFFASYLAQGQHELKYKLRCETPGTFHALPTRVEAMYSPFVRSNSRSDVVTISGH